MMAERRRINTEFLVRLLRERLPALPAPLMSRSRGRAAIAIQGGKRGVTRGGDGGVGPNHSGTRPAVLVNGSPNFVQFVMQSPQQGFLRAWKRILGNAAHCY